MKGIILADLLKFWANRWPDRPAICLSDGSETSWSDLANSTDRIAAGLHSIGIGCGDAVGILMSNRIEFIEAILAILKVGGQVTILNMRFTDTELLHPIKDARLRAVFTEPDFVKLLERGRQECPDLQVITTGPSDSGIEMRTLRACDDAPPSPLITEDDVALICYSSGTTGFPKGVMLSHRNIREGALATAIPCCITPDDRVLISAPLAYTWGIVQYLRESLVTGCTATLVDPSSGVDELINVLMRDRISMWSAVPVMFEQVAASPRFPELDFSNLRHAISGGASIHLQEQWKNKGVMLSQAYGLSETGGHVSVLFGEHAKERMDQSGQALPGVDLAIMNDAGDRLPVGEAGEICIRGPMVMRGYLNNPEETARTIVDGWLRTGDIGTLDAEGFLKVTGRSKDMIRSGGLNIYPAELERILAGTAGLEDFAIIPVGDERWGEVPMIICNGQEPDISSLRERCLQSIASYKRPQYILRYGKSLPRTFSGKIKKHALRDEFPVPPESAVRLEYK